MEEAVKTPNVVEATNKPGLYEKLEDMKKRWVRALGDRVPARGLGGGVPRAGPGSEHLSWGAGTPRPRRGLLRERAQEMERLLLPRGPPAPPGVRAAGREPAGGRAGSSVNGRG